MKTFTVSVSRLATGKEGYIRDKYRFGWSFYPEQHTIESLIKLAAIEGYSFLAGEFARESPAYYGRADDVSTARITENFRQTFIIPLDDDGKESDAIEFWENDLLFKTFGGGYYHSASSTQEQPRIRPIFELDSPITDSGLYQEIRHAFGQYFPQINTAVFNDINIFFGQMEDVLEFVLREQSVNQSVIQNAALHELRARILELDPVTLALVQNRLDHISHQMGWVMTRTARSPIFSQSHDFSCFIADARGTLISQADGIPIHTGGGGFAVRAILRDFKDAIEAEDVFLLNDPYTAGGNHLPDWVIARPVFVAGKLLAFACNRAHQADIGGGAAGTYNSAATEIFHEGIRLPVLKLIERGRTRDDLWRLLMINTRLPEAQDGDLRAMIGSTRIGAERLAALIEELGPERAPDFFEGVLAHADRRFRACVARLAKGVWRAEEPVDNDCFEPIDGKIVVTLTVKDSRLIVDFAGTTPQLRGFKNSSIANSTSAVFMALSSFFEPDLPKNEGAFRSVEIRLPEGTMVNARAPAPMTMNTSVSIHRVV
jgi:hypothetical protein